MARSLLTLHRVDPARAVILVAHGGKARSRTPDSHLRPPALRMLTFTADLAWAGRRCGLQVSQLRYGSTGYNDGEAVDDLRWALDGLAEHRPLPVCLVGHSMGARAALRAAGHPTVTSVVALAPWLPDGEPVEQLAGRDVLIAHGDRDRVTSPRASAAYAQRARPVARSLSQVEVKRSGHAMLRRARAWRLLVRHFCLGQLQGPAPREASG